ncbi:MAG: Ig-like domain-containing protein [Pseudomonadota bacterium]
MPDILWSEFRMPDGRRPGPDDVVVVDSDVRLIFDAAAGEATVKGLVVYGEFTAEEADTPLALTTDWAVVAGDGSFSLGTPETPYAGDFTLTLAGKDNRNTVDLRDYPDGCETEDACPITGGATEDACPITGGATCQCGDTGPDGHGHAHVIENNNAFLMAMGPGATISIHADDAAKESWAQLDATARPGDTTLTLDEATGWQVGDVIAVASTDFDLNQAETFTVTAVADGGRTVTLDRPVEFMHYGAVEQYANDEKTWSLDMRAEVALLSRDVTIQGDIDYDDRLPLNQQPDQYGGHTMVMHGGEMYLSGVELAFMGQAGILGRYPAHWHLSEDVTGQYIQNSSVHHSFNNGITVHGAENARVADNAIFETIGHGVFLEDGSEIGNQIVENLAFNQRHPGLFNGSPGGNQDDPSSFWIENAGNTFRGNHAAGSEGTGFFFDTSGGVDRPSRQVDSLEDNGSREGPTDMVDNVVHSSNRGFFLNHANLVQDKNPAGDAEQAQKVAPWLVEDITVYKIDGRGLYVRGVEGVFEDVKMAEVGEGTRFRLNQGIEDGLIVGRTQGNIGTPTTETELAEGRSLPFGQNNFSGHLLYDGPGGIKDVHFDGFYDERDYAIDLTNAIHKSTLHYVEGLTWGPEETMRWEQRVDFGTNTAENQNASEMLVDLDGSLTGIQGGAILTDEPNRADAAYGFNRSENAVVFEEWGAVASPFSDVDFIGLMNVRVVDENGDYRGDTPYNISNFEIDVVRNDGPVVDNLGVGPGTGHRQTPIVDGYTYEMTLRGDPPQFHFWMTDMPEGASVVYQINGLAPDALFYLKNPNTREIVDIREVTSLEMLAASPNTAIFRDLERGETHIKFVSEMFYGWDFAKPQQTKNDALTGGVIVNVDQRPGSLIDLSAIAYDDPVQAPPPPPQPQPQNTAPVVEDDTAAVTAGETVMVDVLANDSDADGDTLTLSLVTVGDGLDVTMQEGGMLEVSTEAAYAGTTTVTYAVDDGNGGTAEGTLSVSVEAAPNTAPVARDDTVTLGHHQGRAIRVLNNDNDADGDDLTLSLVSVTDGLFAEVRDDRMFVRGDWTYSGQGTVVYGIDDGNGGTDTAEINVTVTPRPNEDPVARNDTASTLVGQRVQVGVKGNDTDPDGDNLSVRIIDGPDNGTAELRNNGNIRYTPDQGFVGTDTITYRLSDPFGGTDTATFSIDVRLPEVPADGPVYGANANGNYVFEAESAIDQDRPGGWSFRTAADLPQGHDAPTGGGYVEATSANAFGQHRNPEDSPEGVLTYRFQAEQDGFVQIHLVASYIGSNPTEHNDTWTGILKDGVPVPAVSPQGTANQNKLELQPLGLLGLYKTYHSGGSSNDFLVANRNIDHTPRAIVVPVEAGEIYTFVMMERSAGHQVDRIALMALDSGQNVGLLGSDRPGVLQEEPLSPVLSDPGQGDDDQGDAPPPSPPSDPIPGPAPDYDIELFLVDADTEQQVATIRDGATLDLALLSEGNFSIEAVPDFQAASMRLIWSGGHSQIENVAPFALFGDTGFGADYFGSALTAGDYSLTVEAYSGAGASGTLLTTMSTSFAVSQAAPPPPPPTPAPPPAAPPGPVPGHGGEIALYLVDAVENERVASIVDGGTLDFGLLSDGLFSVEVDPSMEAGSVRMTWSGGRTQVENILPYALFGDTWTDGEIDYHGSAMAAGEHTVSVEVFAGANATGAMLGSTTASFTMGQGGGLSSLLSVGLYDTATDTLVTTLGPQTTLSIDQVAGRQLAVVADLLDESAPVGSVRIESPVAVQVENLAPYAEFGDLGGDLIGGRSLAVGRHDYAIDVFAGAGASGLLRESVDFSIRITEAPTVPATGPAAGWTPSSQYLAVGLYDTASDTLIATLDGTTALTLDQVAGRELALVAWALDGAQGPVESIQIVSPDASRIENIAPYAEFGDLGVDFLGGRTLEAGTHSYTLNSYAADGASGALLESLVLDVEVVDENRSFELA